MKIIFIDVTGGDYDTQTPLQRPLGGTQSCVAYLSAALARLGHEIGVINMVQQPRTTDGVIFTALPCPSAFIKQFDIVIVVAAAMGLAVRQLGVTAPMYLWCHHAPDQAAVRALSTAEETGSYQGFIMVSQWQADAYHRHFAIPYDRITILRNAIAPGFKHCAVQPPWYRRNCPPSLVYTSTPFRGLDVLLMAFPMIRAAVPGVSLKVYSGLSVYADMGLGVEVEKDSDFQSLYQLCLDLPGVEYVGGLSQSALCQALSQADILAYPSTFAETGCIAAMEAMAAGLTLVTTALGALPETTNGYARLIDPNAQVPSILATRFAQAVIGEITLIDEGQALRRREDQIAFARSYFDWEQRSRQWSDWMATRVI